MKHFYFIIAIIASVVFTSCNQNEPEMLNTAWLSGGHTIVLFVKPYVKEKLWDDVLAADPVTFYDEDRRERTAYEIPFSHKTGYEHRVYIVDPNAAVVSAISVNAGYVYDPKAVGNDYYFGGYQRLEFKVKSDKSWERVLGMDPEAVTDFAEVMKDKYGCKIIQVSYK